MAKEKPTPLLHTERLLSLVPFIAANQGIALAELASTFKVTSAQMSADLTTLWMCGLPGYTALELMDLSFDSGYVSIRNAETLESPRTLNFDEIVALLMGLDLLKDSLDSDSDLRGTIEVLTTRLSQKSGIVSKLRATSDVSSTLRAQIENALKSQKALRISYHSLYNDSVTERLVSPLEMRIDNGVEYLFSFCHTALAFRIFRLDRIIRCTAEEKTHVPNSDLQSKTNPNVKFAIKVRSRLRLMKERFSLQNISTSELQRSESFSEEWIIRSIFGSSGSVELMEPSALRAEIARKAQLILDRYLSN